MSTKVIFFAFLSIFLSGCDYSYHTLEINREKLKITTTQNNKKNKRLPFYCGDLPPRYNKPITQENLKWKERIQKEAAFVKLQEKKYTFEQKENLKKKFIEQKRENLRVKLRKKRLFKNDYRQNTSMAKKWDIFRVLYEAKAKELQKKHSNNRSLLEDLLRKEKDKIWDSIKM